VKITLDTYYDKWHPELTEFRKTLCIELGADNELSTISHKALHAQYPNNKFAEEIYKFSNGKWTQTHFDAIECIKIDGKIVGMSGCAIHNNSIRILMHRYSLLSSRSTVNTYTWHENGTIDRHHNYAKLLDMKAIYFTIYEHNVTLKMFSNYLKQRKTNKKKPMLGEFDFLPKPMMFNNVLQTIFYYKIDKDYNFTVRDVV
jgi:hypothetical protein